MSSMPKHRLVIMYYFLKISTKPVKKQFVIGGGGGRKHPVFEKPQGIRFDTIQSNHY